MISTVRCRLVKLADIFYFRMISVHPLKKALKTRLIKIKKSARRDSNPRPRPWQGRTPPTEPLAHTTIISTYQSFVKEIL